jgi:hypothetical protein
VEVAYLPHGGQEAKKEEDWDPNITFKGISSII